MTITASKAARKAKAKDNGEKAKAAKPVAEAIIAKVAEDVAAAHAQGHRVKELRDTGMAWWAIAHEMGLPGSAPNVKAGKSGAARARMLYRKTFGELPGGTVARSTKAQRTSSTGAPVVRKAVFHDLEDFIGIREAIAGKLIRWQGRIGEIRTEREARVCPRTDIRIEDGPQGTVITFREDSDKGAGQWRSVYAADVYDLRK